MITVYWTDDRGMTNSLSHTNPIDAAQCMSAVQLYDNLYPAGWSWDTDEEWYRVRSIRDGRDYGVDMRGWGQRS